MNDYNPPRSLVRLPRHARRRRGFEEAFGRSDRATIAAMDAAGDDVPGQAPPYPLPLRRMGLGRAAIPVSVQDPFDPQRGVRLDCAVECHTSVGADRRGIHVSRIGDLLARLSQRSFPTLSDYAAELCAGLRGAQDSEAAEVEVSGVLTYVEEVAGVKPKASLEHLTLYAGARLEAGAAVRSTGVGFNHMTACPCVQQTYRHSFDDARGRLLDEMAAGSVPFLTHTQRCTCRISIVGPHPPVPLRELVECVDRVVVRCQNTLPRELELLAVHRAHARPQFLEDALRELLHAVYRLIGPQQPDSSIAIRASSLESIHDFDISGEIGASVAELAPLLPA